MTDDILFDVLDHDGVHHEAHAEAPQALCGATVASPWLPPTAGPLNDPNNVPYGCDACAHLGGRYEFPDGTPHMLDGSCCGKHYELGFYESEVPR